MKADAVSEDARKLKAIRLMLDCVDGKALMLTGEPEGMVVSIERLSGRLVPVAKFLPAATSTDMEVLAGALENVRFLAGLVERAAKKIRELERLQGDDGPAASAEQSGKLKGGSNFAAEAAMRCSEPVFKKFLMECHGLESPATDEACAAKLRQMLGVRSRSQINHEPDVAERWNRLKGEFKAWRRN